MKSFVRISALLWADILVVYALFVMQNYLTEVWNLSFTHAAGILNICAGVSMVLLVFFLFLVDTVLGNFTMLVISSIAYSVGIGFVTMSTPPVLANSTGTCTQYKSACIGHTQKVLFYSGMALIAVGAAGNLVSVKPFLDEQEKGSHDKALRDDSDIKDFLKLPVFIVVVVIPVVGAIALPYIKPWSLRFGIPAICTVTATLLFLSGSRTYNKVKPQGSPITSVCRVFVAAALKKSQSLSPEARLLYEENDREPQSFSRTHFLRCLEKAAIILPDTSLEDQKKNKWRLCSVEEVEAAKIAVGMVPMWTTFVICGMVSSFGNTYFIEQANHMNRKIGTWNVPSQILLLLSQWASICIIPSFARSLLKKSKTYGTPTGIAVAVTFSILCCITAAAVEIRRLKVIRSHDLLEKPGEKIPMSVFWLLFQFFLLAGLDSFLETSVTAFYNNQSPDCLKNYLGYFAKGVYGLGYMCNVLSAYVVGKISEKGGKRNWFQFTLNKSHLDRYYWVLAALSFVNLLVFVLVAWCYRYMKKLEASNVGVNDTRRGSPHSLSGHSTEVSKIGSTMKSFVRISGKALYLKSFVRIAALLWADILVAYALFVMQNYLTNVWKLSFVHAAGILNIWGGISMILPVFFLFLVDAVLGNFTMLVISSIAYSVGIGFVTMSTPPVLAKSTGTCKTYEPKCIGHTQKFLFYTGMVLIAVGAAGNLVSVRPFLEEQKTESNANAMRSKNFFGIRIVGAIALPYIKPWSLRFGIPAICTAVATLLFLSGSCTYEKARPQGSPITSVCRVFVAAASKKSQPFPLDSKQLYEKNREHKPISRARFLRCLEKAAIILPDTSLEEQEKNRWRLCTVTEVEAAKIVVRMVPMWTTFIICGIVSSIGNTYFIAQANHMNRKIGSWKVPLQVLLLLSQWAKDFIFASWARRVLEKFETYGAPIGIGVAMIFSILCCITAARVESRRLKVIRNHGLVGRPEEDIPMSVYWLLFQFFLLAGLDTFFEWSVRAFYNEQSPECRKNYLRYFTKGVSGLGFMCSVLSVYVVGRISEKGGKNNWFQFTLNGSRLDRYYWVLAALSSVNLLIFIVVAGCYRYRDREAPNEGVIESRTGIAAIPPADDEAKQCCYCCV